MMMMMMMSSFHKKGLDKKLENIDENGGPLPLPHVTDGQQQQQCLIRSVPSSCASAAPETPTESMEFLARSWSLSAMELSKALSNPPLLNSSNLHTFSLCPQLHHPPPSFSSNHSLLEKLPSGGSSSSPPISPRDSEEMKSLQELFILHQALNPELLSSQQLLRNNGIYKSILKGRTTRRWLKDQKERKKHEMRTHNAQLHAAVSVAGVAAAVAAVTASNAMQVEMSATETTTMTHQKAPPQPPSRTSAAMASAAALVASHCIEIAEEMGADRDQILTAVNSAINARTNGDIMTLTAGAATALRGAATLRARLQKGNGTSAFAFLEEKSDEAKELNISAALNFASRGGELLKRTRKGALHWKQVSFNINSNWQVVAKMKSKHMAGAFTKKKKCVVSAVYREVPAWPGREREDTGEQREYFGIKTAERVIEFECRNKGDKLMWTEGIQHMLNCRANIA